MSQNSSGDQSTFRNALLAALPFMDRDRLRPCLQRVRLVIDQLLHEVGNPFDAIFFVEDGLLSLKANTGDNGRVEVGMTGREDLVGTSEAAQELCAVGGGIEALRLVYDKIYSANDGMDRACLAPTSTSWQPGCSASMARTFR